MINTIRAALSLLLGVLTFIIVSIYCYSLLAPYHWVAALLSHFTLYYCVASAATLPFVIILCRKYFRFLLVTTLLVVTLSSYAQTRNTMEEPLSFASPSGTLPSEGDFKVAQYNKLDTNQSYALIASWAEHEHIDLLVLQEVENNNANLLREALKQLLPEGPPVKSIRPNGLLVLSRFPIQNYETKIVYDGKSETHAVRFDVEVPNDRTIRVYTVHTEKTLSKQTHNINKEELLNTAKWLAEDSSDRIIFMGDWNTSSYSPVFKEVLRATSLYHQSFSIIPENTWPSFMPYKILQLPIDHILYKQQFTLADKGYFNLIEKRRGPSMGSDHHSLIANFELE